MFYHRPVTPNLLEEKEPLEINSILYAHTRNALVYSFNKQILTVYMIFSKD